VQHTWTAAGPVRSSSPVRPLQRLVRFAARESDLNSSSVLRKVAPGYRFQGEISFRGKTRFGLYA